MFETLTERLTGSFSFFRGKKELTESNIDEGLSAVRQALLEADVNFRMARDFTERAFQALALVPGGLPEGGGLVTYAPEFADLE